MDQLSGNSNSDSESVHLSFCWKKVRDNPAFLLEVNQILASISVSAPNVDKWALSADILFRPKAVVSQFGALSISAGCSW